MISQWHCQRFVPGFGWITYAEYPTRRQAEDRADNIRRTRVDWQVRVVEVRQ